MTSLPYAGITGIDTHAHIFRQDLPMVPGRRYSPGYDATVEQYLAHLDGCNLSHGVLIQPSFLGTDNHYMVEALRRFPERLRGVAVVDARVSDAELDELAAVGVVGVRLNLIGKALADYAGSAWDNLFRRLAQRGWQVEIQRGFDDLVLIVPTILDSGVSVVIDHFGLPDAGVQLDDPQHDAFFALLGQAPVWIKLSAAYRSQSDLARAQAIEVRLREACGGVDRFLWGSDWPNTQFESQTRYDQQFALFEALLPNPEERRRVLVDNPATLFGFA
ncbi:Predicted metal-dependent hydrolase, TIM-barrel fold [Pseudomonas sp. 8Z]|uniref:amidohydrolase family protein n=1 Tax=Pseudomonas sp. 8Z TaxID=2653166 RepID=UPI0012F30AE7|nr:amidohydrolase family protein [Pseudomonas sp. 8Z]VXC60878.1 Predicted metal-dependent hydrolase, TIM-barrel fold [Pseudomonas sp. 8Z]